MQINNTKVCIATNQGIPQHEVITFPECCYYHVCHGYEPVCWLPTASNLGWMRNLMVLLTIFWRLLARNESRLKKNETRLARNETRLARETVVTNIWAVL